MFTWDADFRDALLEYARSESASETCALLGAEKRVPTHVTRFYPVPNVAPNGDREFAMDPRLLARAVQRLHSSGGVLWGIFHSHLAGPAEPSEEDRQLMAVYTGIVHVIAARAADPVALGCYRRGEDGMIRRVIVLELR